MRDAHHIPCNYARAHTHTHTHTHTQVEDIRMMRDRDGNLRGFCYIDFAAEAGALAGLSKDKSTLGVYLCVCVCVCVCLHIYISSLISPYVYIGAGLSKDRSTLEGRQLKVALSGTLRV